MAIKKAIKGGYQRWSADEYNYFRRTDIFDVDQYDNTVLDPKVEAIADDVARDLKAAWLPSGELILSGSVRVVTALAAKDTILTFDFQIQNAVSHIGVLRDTAYNPTGNVIIQATFKDNKITAGSETVATGTYIDFTGIRLIPGAGVDV